MQIRMSKWDNVGTGIQKRSPSTPGSTGTANYVPKYARTPAKFSPRRAVRSFRDLEVYQKTMECSILVGKHIEPELAKQQSPLLDGMRNCALSIPLFVAEAHGLRFASFEKGVATLERAMQDCNKMIVYLEQVTGLYETIDKELATDLSMRYMLVRGKMLRLERSWQKFRTTNSRV